MAEPRARSALARFAAADGLACWSAEGIALRELPYAAIVRVQALDDDGCSAAGTAIGVELPGPGALVQGDGLTVAWVAPNEWLVFLAASAEPALVAALAVEGVFATSIGDARTGIAVDGVRAAEVLARGTGIDLHPAVFPEGRVCNTRLAQLAVMLARPPSVPGFHLWVDRSAGAWLWQWMRQGSFPGTRVGTEFTAALLCASDLGSLRARRLRRACCSSLAVARLCYTFASAGFFRCPPPRSACPTRSRRELLAQRNVPGPRRTVSSSRRSPRKRIWKSGVPTSTTRPSGAMPASSSLARRFPGKRCDVISRSGQTDEIPSARQPERCRSRRDAYRTGTRGRCGLRAHL